MLMILALPALTSISSAPPPLCNCPRHQEMSRKDVTIPMPALSRRGPDCSLAWCFPGFRQRATCWTVPSPAANSQLALLEEKKEKRKSRGRQRTLDYFSPEVMHPRPVQELCSVTRPITQMTGGYAFLLRSSWPSRFLTLAWSALAVALAWRRKVANSMQKNK